MQRMQIVATLFLVTGSAALPLWAQSPTFEVATVKVNRTGAGRSGLPRLNNSRVTAENATLKSMLQVAYGLNELQITGPGWMETERYDLEAKTQEGSIADAVLMSMLQSLLKDRFHLAAHLETKEATVFDLVIAKGGARVSAFDPSHIPPAPPRNGATSMIIGPMTMDQLAGNLARPAGRPVINKTHLEGRYFCAVAFSPLSAQANATGSDADVLDIFAAVQQQLGLKLEPSKALVEFLIVDHAEQTPTEN